MKNPLYIGLCLLVVLVTACQPATQPPAPTQAAAPPALTAIPVSPATSTAIPGELVATPDKLAGIWQIETSHWPVGYMIIRPDGTINFSRNQDGSSPSQSGKYWFEQNQIVLDTDLCAVPGRFEVRLVENDAAPAQLLFTLVKDDESCINQYFTYRIPTWVEALPILQPGEKFATLPEEIVGTWKGNVEGEEGFLIVRDDETATLAEFQDGTSGNTHEYWFDGDQFNIKSEFAIHSCDQVGKYQIRIRQDGDKTVSLIFVLTEDPCNPRIRDLVNNTSIWLLP